MNTYDELYDDIKRAVNEGFEMGHIDDWHDGAFHAYRYVLDRLEEIREAEEKQHKSEISVGELLDTIENLERTLSELQSESSEIYLALCEMELKAKKGGA